MWELTNLNKKSLAVDIGQKEGREIIYRLAAKCDVFLSNLRNRETAKFEMDYDTIKKRNPKIIYANLTGFGPEGPDSDLPGWDSLAYFARSGVTYMLSRPESKLRHGVVWYLPTGWETKDSFGSRVPRSVD